MTLDFDTIRGFFPKPGARPNVVAVVATTDHEASHVLSTIRDYSLHHSKRFTRFDTVNYLVADGGRSSLALAILNSPDGHIIVLEDFSHAHPNVLRNMRRVLDVRRLSLLVVLLDSMDSMQQASGSWEEDLWERLQACEATLHEDVSLPPRDLRVEEALAAINKHRRRLGQRPLDPRQAGWTDEDILIEAARIGALPQSRTPTQQIRSMAS